MTNHITQANGQSNAVSYVIKSGEDILKENILKSIPARYETNHRNMLVYIHDLEYYRTTYNCIGVSVQDLIKNSPHDFRSMLRELYRKIVDLTNWQSGGIGFINFDGDAKAYITDETDAQMQEALHEFFLDLNMNVRKGCEKAYVTFNFGLDTSENGRRISRILLDTYLQGDEYGNPLVFPNLVFKLKSGVNVMPEAPNYDIYQKALTVTAKRMVPTYFNCDSSSNKDFPSETIGIMGCRTRVANNLHGKEGSLNRGNIACMTLNLVQMALKAERNWNIFYQQLDRALIDARDVLLHRFYTLCEEGQFEEYYEKEYYLNSKQHKTAPMLQNGTLAIGFIGLWDAFAVMYHKAIDSATFLDEHYEEALALVQHMREFTDQTTKLVQLNFSLLATAAEGVTGKFTKYDEETFPQQHSVLQDSYYTNSFHTPVRLKLGYRKKIELESAFHALCNGGSITYVELAEMPLHNVEAVQEIVEYAYQMNCNYFGINFPLDSCRRCGYTGRIHHICPHCQSDQIKRLRRVSGYLAEEDRFTTGKKENCRIVFHNWILLFNPHRCNQMILLI